MTSPEQNMLRHVKSMDGTTIAVERVGHGTPLVLVHGTSSKRSRWQPILGELSALRTCHLIDRRGRGDSGDGPGYDITREFEDVAAVVDSIGGPVDILAHSYGAICSLGATQLTQNIGSLILYEPPLGSIAVDNPAPRIIAEQAANGQLGDALETFLREILKLGDVQIEAARKAPNWAERAVLASTIGRECITVQSFSFSDSLLKNVRNNVHLLIGDASPALFQNASIRLAEQLGNSSTTMLAGQQHQAIDTAPDLFLSGTVPRLSS